MAENLESIIGCITAIVGLVTLIITEYKRNIYKQSKEDYYYRNLLKPFIKAYINKKDIDVMTFVKNTIKRDDDNIPKYIYYLIEKKNPDLLKVLIYDYCDLYQNEENRRVKLLNGISKCSYFVLFLMSLIMLLVGAYAVVEEIFFICAKFLQLILEGYVEFQKGWEDGIKLLIIVIICFASFFSANLVIRELNYDRYTIKKRKIKRIVNTCAKTYNKNVDKIYF